MNKDTWLDIKHQQVNLYRERARTHSIKRGFMMFTYISGIIFSIILPLVFLAEEQILAALASLVLIPVSMLVWKISTHENRSKQLLRQLADEIEKIICNGKNLDLVKMKQHTTKIETRFLSNDDELFVKKAIWKQFLNWKKAKRDEEIRYNRAYAKYRNWSSNAMEPRKQWIWVGQVKVGTVWNTDIPHRQGYKDSNTIADEWAIMKAFRRLIWASEQEIYGILDATSRLAQNNPVVFERYLRKKKISKKMKTFKWRAWVHYLSPAAKMRLVTFVEQTLALEPTHLHEDTVTLLHEKNEQIAKYTKEFWKVHYRSLKYYWLEALWLLLLIPFLAGSGNLISSGSYIEAVLLFTVGASLVAFGEMALIVRQKIKLNGKKLVPPLIASLVGSRHAMCADTKCEMGIDRYRRRFKNLEKHFIMTTPEIDSVKYVKDNLRDETRNSKIHAAEAICEEAESRMATYYRMFHLYRKRCLQYSAAELFLGIMLLPIWGLALFGALAIGLTFFLPMMATITVGAFEVIAMRRHIRVWRFKEMYFKIYQGLSVLIVDGDLRQDPEKLNEMFTAIEQSALDAISQDRVMKLMVGTLSRISGLHAMDNAKRHPLDTEVTRIRTAWMSEIRTNAEMKTFGSIGTNFRLWIESFRD